MKQTISIFVLIFLSCNSSQSNDSMEVWQNEIIAVEHAFAEMAHKEGIPKAFLAFAAEDAVLMRNNSLTIGKTAIKERFSGNMAKSENVSLSWKPDFVDVSASGDLGYTYGKYVYTIKDSIGNETIDEGVFHTVWKRQADGSWKFVWD